MKYHVAHTTTYRYTEPASLGHNVAHLTPRSWEHQRLAASRLRIRPTPAAMQAWDDYFGNRVSYFTVEQPHRELSVHAESDVQVLPPTYPEPRHTPRWEDVLDTLRRRVDPASAAAVPFTLASQYVPQVAVLAEYAAHSFSRGRPILECLLDVTDRIHGEFKYDPSATCVNTPVLDVFQKRRGVCQDFAHLQIACLRGLGFAARYVSGYLLTDPPPGKPKLIGADASHAWLSVYCPGHGWLDLDPTNNLMPALRHVTLAWGRDYADVCPIKGVVLGGGQHAMTVAVDVSPVPGHRD